MPYKQKALFEGIRETTKGLWATKLLTLSFDETALIRGIMNMYNDGQPFDLDPTYSTGRFYRNLPQPKLKFDIDPQAEGVQQADVRDLPLEDGSVHSIMFDPPFVVGIGTTDTGIIRGRFGGFKTMEDLMDMYALALIELRRVLAVGGLLVFKCQDTVCNKRQWLTHVYIINMAVMQGFYVRDLFVLGRHNVLWSPNMANQQHARKNHCYFLVMFKEE